MSRFTEAPFSVVLEVQGVVPKYRTLEDINWDIGYKDSGFVFNVPRGFVFDVSIPFGLRWLFSPRNQKYFKAAALHDKMLQDGFSRLTAGAEFHNALQASGVGVFERLVMWFFVSLWKYWLTRGKDAIL